MIGVIPGHAFRLRDFDKTDTFDQTSSERHPADTSTLDL
jgi:hypothetical protein